MRVSSLRQLAKFHDEIGDDVFNFYDVAEALGTDLQRANNLIAAALAEKHIFRVINGQTAAAITNQKISTPFFSFDPNKTGEDVLNRYDPIPLEERTLEPQLFGETALRYREVYAWRMYRTPPAKPLDRPLDQWEQQVFHKLQRSKQGQFNNDEI